MYAISLFVRCLLCIIPYLILVSNKSIIYHITGPITIPPFNQSKGPLIYWIAAIELFRVFYSALVFIILKLMNKRTLRLRQSFILKSMTLRYVIVILMKLFIVFYEFHRLKYYLHVFFLELFIMTVNVLADIVDNHKVSLVMDIIIVDGLNRVAIFYELTRTFNPNFGLYFFGNSLLSLICYMLQGDRKLVLYVRHDIYRIMIVTMGYLFMFSLFQLSITYRPFVIFILTGYFFYEMIQEFSHEQIETLPVVQEKKNRRRDYLIFLPPSAQVFPNPPSQTTVSFKDVKKYLQETMKKKALLNFLVVALITIIVELLFIYSQPDETSNHYVIEHQVVKNTFMEFYKATMQNVTLG